MVVLINTKKNDCYICKQVDVSRLVGISPVTVSRWKSNGSIVEVFNEWNIYFNPVKMKSKSGFASRK